MTVTDKPRIETKDGNGTTGPYSVSYGVADQAELKVTQVVKATGATVSVLTLTTDYTVFIPAPPLEGADITTTAVIPVTDQLVIEGDVIFRQSIDYVANDPFPAQVAEGGYDRLTYMAQQLRDLISRTISLPLNTTLSGITVPAPVSANLIRWNAAADGFENVTLTGTGVISIPVSLAEGGSGATTAAGARTAFGLGALAVLSTVGVANLATPVSAAVNVSLFKLL